MNSNNKDFFTFKNILWIFLIPAFYLFIEFVWKPLFIQGKISGIYWLAIFADKTTPILAASTIILSLILFIVFIAMAIFKPENKSITCQASFYFFLCSLIFGFIFLFGIFPVGKETFHLHKLIVRQKVYYLAAYDFSSLRTDFSLYECDNFGILCRRAYHSDNYEVGPYGRLKYNQVDGKIQVNIPGNGTIYEYKIP